MASAASLNGYPNQTGNFVPNASGMPSVGVGGLGNCDVPNTGFVPDPIRPVKGCNGDTPRGCLAPLPVERTTISAAQAAAGIVEVDVKPVQPFYAVGALIKVRDAAGALVTTTARLIDIRHERQSILPRGFAGDAANPNSGYDLDYFTMEAFRSGVNPWPRNSPIFVQERPLKLVFAGAGLVENGTIDVLLYARNMSE